MLRPSLERWDFPSVSRPPPGFCLLSPGAQMGVSRGKAPLEAAMGEAGAWAGGEPGQAHSPFWS